MNLTTSPRPFRWRLQKGSHSLPGPEGDTCINELALIVAGFAYRRIRSVEAMPSSFSRPLCRLALSLNDQADDQARQRLLPYVIRLACADTAEIELEREAFIIRQQSQFGTWSLATEMSAIPCGAVVGSYNARFASFEQGLTVLEGALAIGRQAVPLPIKVVTDRMASAIELATENKGSSDGLMAWIGQNLRSSARGRLFEVLLVSGRCVAERLRSRQQLGPSRVSGDP